MGHAIGTILMPGIATITSLPAHRAIILRVEFALETMAMPTLDRITFDSSILGGRATIRGMRISVSLIVSQIAHGASSAEILDEYPDLEADDIRQALEYAAWLSQEEVHTLGR